MQILDKKQTKMIKLGETEGRGRGKGGEKGEGSLSKDKPVKFTFLNFVYVH